MKQYTFKCYDSETCLTTIQKLTTESDCWSGYDGPVYHFQNFLQGCGFVFDINDEMGVMGARGFSGCMGLDDDE